MKKETLLEIILGTIGGLIFATKKRTATAVRFLFFISGAA